MRGLKGVIVAGMAAAAAAVLPGCSVETVNQNIGQSVCLKDGDGTIKVLTREGVIIVPKASQDMGNGTCKVGSSLLILRPNYELARQYYLYPPIAEQGIYPYTPSGG